ncbi:MAG TPA: hypothetical protein VNU92_05415 [Edaphobacter sp.]|nr:hypothetical protein [Edaphobacter sp.]
MACNSLPSAVQQESKTFLGGGTTLRGCVKDVSAGETTYEVELLTSTGSKDVTFSATGDVLEIEQEVQESALPPVVAAAFEKAARGGALGKIESLTRKGQLAGYESTISQGGKRREVAFRPDGSAMKAD